MLLMGCLLLKPVSLPKRTAIPRIICSCTLWLDTFHFLTRCPGIEASFLIFFLTTPSCQKWMNLIRHPNFTTPPSCHYFLKFARPLIRPKALYITQLYAICLRLAL
ncbi:hypothetical protein ES332_D03G130200v1 [Gossypium tomentosum]|uniref:Uncharacterized protein n=1 Tax=Gossypium tomentosum TaxID=34277 RepID=A0A5D2LMS2_GOSTO|nr:hypothetical protein ES332_D03G130200v1 [Gossypium tomentosum]